MFGGIGARGGKKDQKQRIKNAKVQRKKLENLEIEQKEQKEAEKERKKREEEQIQSQRIPKAPEHLETPVVPRIPKKAPGEVTKREPVVHEVKKEIPRKEEDLEKKKDTSIQTPPSILEKPVPFEPTKLEPTKLKEDRNQPMEEWIPIEKPKVALENQPIEKQQEEKREASPITPKEEIPHSSFDIKKTEEISESQKEKEEILEFKVATELERLLKENRYQLKKLYTELDMIQKEKDSIYQVSDTEQAIEEIERLLTYLEQIKRELEVISKSHNLDHIFELKDSYFTDLVEEYKNYVKDQQVIDDTMKDLKRSEEYTDLMKRILEFERMQEDLSLELEDKRKEFEERDANFESLQDEYLDLEKVGKEIEGLISDSEKYLKEIENKVNEAVEVTKRTEIKLHYAMGVLTRALLLFSLLKMNPKPKANLVTAVETMVAVNLIHKLLTPTKEQKTITEYHYHDYQSMIVHALGDIDSIDSLVREGIHQIQDLKRTFENEFSSYEAVFPEYKELIGSIEQMEKDLLEREDHMHCIKDEMKQQLNKNNEKVLEYERLSVENN